MAYAMRNFCRVFLLVCGGVYLAVATRSGGGAGPPRAVAALNEQHQYLCSILSNCTNWCSDCSDRRADNLFDSLDSCNDWNSALVSYRYVSRCPTSVSSYVACVCTHRDTKCNGCEYSNQNNLVCFSQEDLDIHVWPGTNQSTPLNSVLLEGMCPSCSCTTDTPTTPQAPTTPRTMPTLRFVDNDKVDPKTDSQDMTTIAGPTEGPDKIVIIVAAAGGGVLLIVLTVCCVCLCKKCRTKSNKSNNEQEYAYINTEEMRSLKSQASMMSGQHLNERCGHRNFTNEMYSLNAIGNGSTLTAQPPELPGNHPPSSNPPPASYQELNRGPLSPGALNTAMGSGPCPHCRQMVAERSATAPLMDRPGGLDTYPQGVGGIRNPYMALMKNNTCPTPGTPPGEPMCKCHSRPLSECSSITESLNSDGHARAADTLNSTGHESDQRPLSGLSDIQESPYYFKMEATGKEPVPSPKSPEYFKLEDAETLPLDSEVSPVISDPDNNGNNVLVKPISSDKGSTGTDSDKKPASCSAEPADEVTAPSSDGEKQTCSRTISSDAEPRESVPGP